MTTEEKIISYLKEEYGKLKYKYTMIPVLIYIVYAIIHAQYYSYKIYNCDYTIIICNVYEVVRVIKNPGFGISYRYKLNGKEYDDYETEPNLFKDDLKYFLIGKNLPLLICKSNPKYHEILLHPEEFKERNLPYPDSLKIYLEYLK